MTIRRTIVISAMALSLAACASQRGWQPTIDVANDPKASNLANDLAVCKQLANQAADQGDTMAERGGIGALGGAAGGALLGAITGSAATGAAIGAVSGAGLGLGSGAMDSDSSYKKAYSNCMTKRGHPVIN
ncbi:MAG: hypothetical protein AB7H77_00575 [Bdellovibrionales bacterium]